MTPAMEAEIRALVEKCEAFATKLAAGQVDVTALRADAVAVVSTHGIQIPAANRVALNAAMVAHLDRQVALKAGPGAAAAAAEPGCSMCEVTLMIAFSALIILTVAAVAIAVVIAFPEVAGPAVVAFLASDTAVTIVLGIIMTGAEIVAAQVCTKLIKC